MKIWRIGNRSRARQPEPENEPSVPGAGPDFICIGAQKAGTTWLYWQLAAHPDFWMPPRKEIHYFNERGNRPIKMCGARGTRETSVFKRSCNR